MRADPLFHVLENLATVTVNFDGRSIEVPEDISVASALLCAGVNRFRCAAVSGEPRGPYCMMGVCFECLLEIDGVSNCQGCLTATREGLRIRSQDGLHALAEPAAASAIPSQSGGSL